MCKASRIISAVEEYYRFEELGAVIRWADQKYSNRWSLALDRLDRALAQFRLDNRSVEIEGEYDHYLNTILPLMAEHRSNNPDTIDAFLASLRRL